MLETDIHTSRYFHYEKQKKNLFLSHFFKTLALKISGVNGGKIKICISTYVEIYREQGHIHFLMIHWEIRAADPKRYFFEGHTVVLKISRLEKRILVIYAIYK